MKKYNISTNLIQVIKNLYNKATSAVLFNSSIGDWFRTTAGVRQGCLLSPTLFDIFRERIMTDALENHEGTASIGGRTIANLRFVDDINDLAGEEEELANLVERLDKASTAYGMEISAQHQNSCKQYIQAAFQHHKLGKVKSSSLPSSFLPLNFHSAFLTSFTVS